MNYRKLFHLSICSLLAVSMCGTTVCQVLAAENEETADSDNQSSEATDLTEENYKEENSEAANPSQMEEGESAADESEESKEEYNDDFQMKSFAQASSDHSFLKKINRDRLLSEKAFGTYGGLGWYVDKDFVLHLEDGSMIIDRREAAGYKDYGEFIKDVIVENFHGSGQVKIVGDATCLFSNTNLQRFNGAMFDTAQCTSLAGMFLNCSYLKNLNLSTWNTSNVNTMATMFSGCSSIEALDLRNWDTSSVENMAYMFSGCSSIEALNLSKWNTSSVTNMAAMFNGCSWLADLNLKGWNTFRVTDMHAMFKDCHLLQNLDLSMFKTVWVSDLSEMFSGCSGLLSLDLSNFENDSNLKNLHRMFYECSALQCLDLSNLAANKVEDLSEMFAECPALVNLNISSLASERTVKMSGMFQNCSSLASLDLSKLKVNHVTQMEKLFENCSGLETVNLVGWDTSNVRKHTNMFLGTAKMKSMKFQKSYLNSQEFDSQFFPEGYLYFEDEETYVEASYDRSTVKEQILKNEAMGDDDVLIAYIGDGNTKNYPQIKLMPNGGTTQTGSSAPVTYVIRPSRLNLPDNSTFKYGFVNGDKSFLGWNTKLDGSGTFYKNKAEIPKNLYGKTLYAQWGVTKLYATSLRLGANLGINFFFDIDKEIAGDPTAKVMIKFGEQGNTKEIPLSQAVKNTTSLPGKTLYKVVEQLPPEQFTDTMEVWIKTDSFESAHTPYSVKEYARKVLVSNKYSQAMKKLMTAIVLYGSDVQMDLKYKTYSLASKDLPLNQEVVKYAENVRIPSNFYPVHVNDYFLDNIKPWRLEVTFTPRTAIKLYFRTHYSSTEMSNVKATWKGQELKIHPVKDDEGFYYVSVDNVEGLDVNQMSSIKITDENKHCREWKGEINTTEVPCSFFSGPNQLLLKSFYVYVHYLTEYLENRT